MTQVNRYGNLVESDGRGYTWIIGGIKCNTSEENESTMVLGAESGCYSSSDVLDFYGLFSFTLLINDWK